MEWPKNHKLTVAKNRWKCPPIWWGAGPELAFRLMPLVNLQGSPATDYEAGFEKVLTISLLAGVVQDLREWECIDNYGEKLELVAKALCQKCKFKCCTAFYKLTSSGLAVAFF